MNAESHAGNTVEEAASKLDEAMNTHLVDPLAWRRDFTINHAGLLSNRRIHTLLTKFDERHQISMM